MHSQCVTGRDGSWWHGSRWPGGEAAGRRRWTDSRRATATMAPTMPTSRLAVTDLAYIGARRLAGTATAAYDQTVPPHPCWMYCE
jgi:hypothetical protein